MEFLGEDEELICGAGRTPPSEATVTTLQIQANLPGWEFDEAIQIPAPESRAVAPIERNWD